jgi:hypothetical protein
VRPSSSWLTVAGAAAWLALAVSACGSATATTAATAASRPGSASSPGPASSACASTVAATLRQVGERIYHEAATGGDVAQAVHRVQSSAALASAIDSGSASAARSALHALLLGQIVRVEVMQGGRVLASAGAGSAIAAVRGSIPGTSASFVLSVQSDRDYLQVSSQVTGAAVLLLSTGSAGAPTRRLAGTIAGPPPASVPDSGALSYAGHSYQVASLTGAAYPSGALRIALLVPAGAILCPGSLAQARVETLGHVGERVYQEELHGASVIQTQHRLEASTVFQHAVAAGNVAATRAAIVGFFEAHIHVVRVRVTVGRSKIGQHLLVDVGGPYVLAPVHGTLRLHGRVVGRFTWAIQDDAGYLKLAHLFTGADVLMRTGGRQVEGTLSPGPASVPDRGEVSYRGRGYQAYSFTAEAFPSGPLRISLLIVS